MLSATDNRQRITDKRAGTRDAAFSLVEMMAVVFILILAVSFIAPAMTSLKSAGDVNTAAYTMKGVLEQARNYAMANNTYTWVGFYEENTAVPSASPTATPGNGRLVMSIVASQDGTTIYNPNTPASIDPTRLRQVTKLTKIDNVHLAIFADGSGIGSTFDTRPPPATNYDTACSCYNTRNSRFGEINVAVPNSAPSTNSSFPFQYPVGNPAPTAQYTFQKTLQFNPRGESSINSTYLILRVLEIGLLQTHQNVVPAPSPSSGIYPGNVVAVQLAGLSGDLKIYKR